MELRKNDFKFEKSWPAACHPPRKAEIRPTIIQPAAQILPRIPRSRTIKEELIATRTRKFAFTRTPNAARPMKIDVESARRNPDSRKQSRPQLNRPM